MSSPRLLVAVALGGAAGALLRWLLGVVATDGAGFPWTTFGINVTGTFVLALVSGIKAVARRDALAAAFGPGLLGGYTTLSTYAEQARSLLADGRPGLAATYVVGTLAACLAAAALAMRLLQTSSDRTAFREAGGEE